MESRAATVAKSGGRPMPADDAYSQSHPLTVKSDYRAGCHNRGEMSDGFWAKDGLDIQTDTDTGVTSVINKMVWVKHTMSRACRQIIDLDECRGCTAPKDWDYRRKWNESR